MLSREEAIEILKRIEYYDRPFDNSVESSMNSCQIREALAMAINALEQESMEKKVIKMRDATLEERKSVDEYIKSISTTVIDSWNLEHCEDAISRENAILQIQKHQICSGDPEECYPEQCERNVISWLSNLPPVTPTQRWIPVSKRLPKEGETVLVCYRTQEGVAQSACEWFDMPNRGIVWSTLCGSRPIAWMPLPEPYKAEMESEE